MRGQMPITAEGKNEVTDIEDRSYRIFRNL